MTKQTRSQNFTGLIVCILAAVLVVSLGWGIYQNRQMAKEHGKKAQSAQPAERSSNREVSQVLELSNAMIKAMHLQTVAAKIPSMAKVLHLRGSLAFDPNRLSHVHSRFPGQIIELATVMETRSIHDPATSRATRLLQNFDTVQEGMMLAIIQSKDLGEKKSQLADSLTRLRVERKTLDNYLSMYEKGIFQERQVREQEAKVEQSKIAVFTAENTLRAFQVAETEIQQVKESVEKNHTGKEMANSYVAEWSRVVVTAPISGDIVEKNVIVGDIVDANADLFKIVDRSVLTVYLHPYEEDLQTLEQLPKPLQVSIKVPAYPELGAMQCDVDRSSPMIDPNEHMALLIGKVKNPDDKLKANQFVTADVGTIVEKGVVEIPANAVIDLGHEAIVYVQPDADKPIFQRTHVVIVQRYFDVVYVRSELTPEQVAQGLQPIHEGDAVVQGWILELEDYMQQQH